jgi:hypothetical protein
VIGIPLSSLFHTLTGFPNMFVIGAVSAGFRDDRSYDVALPITRDVERSARSDCQITDITRCSEVVRERGEL